MAARSNAETRRFRYLLGLCSQTERERIESEYFHDEHAFQEMLTAEDDLIDAYARGELIREERKSFERNFLNSPRGPRRIQFARALAKTVTDPRPLNTRPSPSFREAFLAWRAEVRIGTIAAVILLIIAFSWLLIDRKRMSNELRELRTGSAKLSDETKALRHGAEAERTRTAEMAAQLEILRRRLDKSAENSPGIAELKPEHQRKPRQQLVNSKYPNAPRDNRADQSNATLDGVEIKQTEILGRKFEDLLTLTPGVSVSDSQLPRLTSGSVVTNVIFPRSRSWIRFQLALASAAQHTDYRVSILTANGRLVTSVDWVEPVTPNQKTIDTPVMPTADLPSGDYVLVLTGKERDGSFLRVANYSFKVIRNE